MSRNPSGLFLESWTPQKYSPMNWHMSRRAISGDSHGPEWEQAFDAIYEEYNRISGIMFP